MKIRWLTRILSMTLSLAAALYLSTNAFAQELVANEALDDWFYSRLMWGALVGVIAGVVIGLAVLCRLKFEVQGALNINNRAQRRLLFWVAVISVAGAVLLFIDAWLFYPFGTLSLTFTDALTQVWSNYRMLLVLILTVIVFVFVVAITTRFKSGCRCRYAFIPGPKGK